MMIKRKTLSIMAAICLPLFSTGCSDIISATRSEPIQENSGSRTVGSYVDDELIETIALVNLDKGSEQMQDANISVTSYNGIVLLTGQAPSESAREEATQIVRQVKKVREIHNEVKIAGVSSTLSRTNDTWITTKVKAQLLTDSSVDGSRVKIITDDSTVYLMGLVSPTEADNIVNIVRGISGVKKIVKVFEYIN